MFERNFDGAEGDLIQDTTIVKIIVQKYGGKSVATIDAIKSVARQVVKKHAEGAQIVVVVSAMANTTDSLLEYAHEISANPCQREVDMLVSAGERISMALLTIAICDLGHEAISFTGSQSGIITEDIHSHAKIVEIRATRIIEELQKNRIVIVAGFQGVSGRREITTLGRGGSDTTAVALACALGADLCEILSDVDGLYSADPKVVSTASHIPDANYDLLFDMTYFGSKVVHPRAAQLAKKYTVPLVLSSSFTEQRRTMISSKSLEGVSFLAVSSQKKVFWVELTIDRKNVLEFFDSYEKLRVSIGNPLVENSGAKCIVKFWIPDIVSTEAIAFVGSFPSIEKRISVCSLVAISGIGIADSPEAVTAVVKALSECAIDPLFIGTTNSSIYAILPQDKSTAVVDYVHNTLIMPGKMKK
jgi:aspartate kinase